MTKQLTNWRSNSEKLRMLLFLTMLLMVSASCRDENFFDRDPEKALTVETKLRNNPEYSKFVEALDNTGLMNYIGSSGLWTVYAPNNTAMANVNLNPATPEENAEFLKLLNYHIGIGLKYTSAIKDDDRLVTRNGKYLALDRDPFAVDGLNFGSLQPDQDANNGVVHEVNQMLVPAPNGGEKLQGQVNTSKFSAAVEKFAEEVFNPLLSVDRNFDGIIDDSVFVATYGLAVDIANESARRTIFAPTDAAIDAYLATQGLSSLDDLTLTQLRTLINKHILIDYKPSSLLEPGMTLTTSGGTGSFTFDPSIVVDPDIPSSNAVIHVINKVLTH